MDESDIEVLDRAIAAVLEGVLRDGRFARLEALWRSLVFLISRIDTSAKTRVYVVDVSRAELEAELSGSGASVRRLLTEPGQGPAVPRWGCVVGAYAFGATAEDVDLLARIGEVARAADLPWVSEALPSWVGSPSHDALSDPEMWSGDEDDECAALRELPGSDWVGLVMPGMLVREHYGESGQRSRVPAFEEDLRGPSDLVWGNPAFVWACVLGRGFAHRGWSSDIITDLGLGQAVVAAFSGEGDEFFGPTRTELSVPGARRIADHGVMPLIGLPHEAAVRLGGVFCLGTHGGGPPRAWWST